jgi:fatty acid/phospholipid biosynthesis enzyme
VTLRIALDAMGGELGPEEMVAGAIQAVEESDLDVVLFGDENILNKVLQKESLPASSIHVRKLRGDHGLSHQVAGPA